MSPFTRFCDGSTSVQGMLLLSLLIVCSSVISASPAISYNEKPHPNATVVVQSSTTENVALNDDLPVTTDISEEPSVAASTSILTTTNPSTTVQLSSSNGNQSSTAKNLTSADIKPTPVNSSLSSNISFSANPTTVAYNSSVDELFYSEANSTKSNASLDEEFLKSSAADSVFNVTVIAGISSLVILIIVLIGVLGFVLYRHFSWNRPQTLSDKFSNDESTGYIDDSAFRENSEEMYSLDNDSFLNSLEAMTIQNYWTDHVKHTKL
ncbi:Hypothetical protein NTJ_05382 [Nesidiocoris tenuis]|uniref:SEA domain-containing protein n=1 Tax=Nesidiocoris tenuis TaxID=355587 RepID=A0ABN7AJZ7_9HEMI|nr:Hypothetical protein NTJ_05382 [Nesidiocoris tenuis]